VTPEIPDEVKRTFSKMDWNKIAKLDWTVEDWTDWYHCIGFALFKILRRHQLSKQPAEMDYQI